MKTAAIISGIALLCLATAGMVAAGSKNKNAARYSNVDMSTVTCNDVLNEKDSQTVAAVLVWVDGYLSCKSNDTRVDVNQLKNLAQQLEGYCRANPSATIMNAVKQRGGKGKY